MANIRIESLNLKLKCLVVLLSGLLKLLVLRVKQIFSVFSYRILIPIVVNPNFNSGPSFHENTVTYMTRVSLNSVYRMTHFLSFLHYFKSDQLYFLLIEFVQVSLLLDVSKRITVLQIFFKAICFRNLDLYYKNWMDGHKACYLPYWYIRKRAQFRLLWLKQTKTSFLYDFDTLYLFAQ